MDYTKNEDYYYSNPPALKTGLYNSVLNKEFDDEGNEPVAVNEAKEWCKIDLSDDDDLIEALITVARQMCEDYSNIGFLARTVTVNINNANGGFCLPYGPVISDPEATDENGDSIDLTYHFGQIMSPYGRFTVTYRAGYETLPANLKTALKAQVLYLYENRGDADNKMSPTARLILDPLVRW